MADRYYIAYGSNLSIEQMKVRTPDAVIVGTSVLEDWRLVFRRYATIKKCEGFQVPVLVWKISEQDEKNLDVYEGYPKFYTKKELKITVKSLNGDDLGKLTAMVYIMTKEAAEARNAQPLPSPLYCSVIANGYYAFHFDLSVLSYVLKEAHGYSQ